MQDKLTFQRNAIPLSLWGVTIVSLLASLIIIDMDMHVGFFFTYPTICVIAFIATIVMIFLRGKSVGIRQRGHIYSIPWKLWTIPEEDEALGKLITFRYLDKIYEISDKPIEEGMVVLDRRDFSVGICDMILGDRIAINDRGTAELGVPINCCWGLKLSTDEKVFPIELDVPLLQHYFMQAEYFSQDCPWGQGMRELYPGYDWIVGEEVIRFSGKGIYIAYKAVNGYTYDQFKADQERSMDAKDMEEVITTLHLKRVL